MFSPLFRPVIAAGLLSVLSSVAMATAPDTASIGACACATHPAADSSSAKDVLSANSQALYALRLTGLENVKPRGQSVVFETSLVSKQNQPVTFRSRRDSYYLVSVTPTVPTHTGNATLPSPDDGTQPVAPDSLDTGYSVTLTPLGVNAKGEVVATVEFDSKTTLNVRHFQVGDGADIPSPDVRIERGEQTVASSIAKPVTLHFGSHDLVLRAERLSEAESSPSVEQ
jgi:hypothetical protein